MRKVVFVSDVHSNLEALDAVLKQTGDLELYFLGDLVGYGADPNAVVERLRDTGATAVQGNHDAAVLSGDVSWFNKYAALAAKWTSGKLSERNRKYLKGLPLLAREEIEGVSVYLTHGSPDDNLAEYVYPQTHSQLFGRYLAKLGVGAIALGHTHQPYSWNDKAGVVFNPGSVGQPRDGDPRASFAVVTFETGRTDVRLLRAEYDIRAAADKILAAGLPEVLASRLFEGR